MNPHAQAVSNLLARPGADESLIAEQLIAHLKKSGRTKMLPSILRDLRALSLRSQKSAAHLEVATEAEREGAAKAAGVLLSETVVNPSLIRGWRLTKGSQLTDKSGKRALIDLYRRITRV